ncbi:alpha/beta hydrolase [Streptomyces sp. NBC_01351]|uniref:alpha/beta hydrolase n=1 Tax=Streptomyces sp. NBC_01351 TaxID=2903833 RepID=UPI002E33E29E|nr:alpha/beta hydrolase [Streptomyces sp. NBC_01351]
MDTRHLVDPQLLPMIEGVPPLDLSAETLSATRAGAGTPSFVPTDVSAEERMVPGPENAPDVRVILTRPTTGTDGPRPGLLWIHGGGYVLGSPDADQALASTFAGELDCVVVSVGYRLAPETPHPGPLHDCYAALTWLHSHAAELGVDPDRIAVAGQSAGGGLTAALAQLATHDGRIPLRMQVLVYPMLDDRTVTRPDPNAYTGRYIWTRENDKFGWTSLLGHEPGQDSAAPYAVPARTEDLTGLPPAFVTVGALDLFLDEDITYAHRLLRSGVPTELHVLPGTTHNSFILDGPQTSARMRQDVLTALRRALAPQS